MGLLLDAAGAAWRFVNGNAIAAGAIAFGLVAGYLALTTYHYNRGWYARDEQLAANVRQLNEKIDELNGDLASAEYRRFDDVAKAREEINAYWQSIMPLPTSPAVPAWAATPGQACPAVPNIKQLCGLPDQVRARLNSIR